MVKWVKKGAQKKTVPKPHYFRTLPDRKRVKLSLWQELIRKRFWNSMARDVDVTRGVVMPTQKTWQLKNSHGQFPSLRLCVRAKRIKKRLTLNWLRIRTISLYHAGGWGGGGGGRGREAVVPGALWLVSFKVSFRDCSLMYLIFYENVILRNIFESLFRSGKRFAAISQQVILLLSI